VLITLVIYRLIDPGSEWRLHRQWYEQSALGDLLGEDFGLAAKDNLYRCLDRLLVHKADLFSFLQHRWKTLFGADFEVLGDRDSLFHDWCAKDSGDDDVLVGLQDIAAVGFMVRRPDGVGEFRRREI